MNIQEYGKNLIRLGELLQDKESSLADISAAAFDCGFKLGVVLGPISDDDPEETDPEEILP